MELIAHGKTTIILSGVTEDDADILKWCGLRRTKTEPIYDEEYDEDPIEIYESWVKEG